MSLTPDIEFSFTSKAVADDFFQVLEFTGFEKVADLYQFDIQLLCQSEDYDLDDLLSEDCRLSLDVYGEQRIINGVLSDFKYLHPSENGHLYQAILVPKLWRLTQITTNEVYLDQALPETLEQLLQEADLNSEHYDLSMLSGYRKWDYRCQFGESHYSFLKRITEREGVYFYFEQGNNTEQIIFCDAKSQHPGNSINSLYSPLVGLAYNDAEPITFQWTKNSQRIAKKVTVKDYNNDRPSEELSASVEVDSKGFGEVFRYCENLVDRDEAENLVQIRAEELLTQKHQFFGASLDVRQQPLQVFELSEHPLQSLNDSFYPIEISHSGYAAGFQFSLQSNEHPYSNEIKALKSDIQFRPALITEKPRFYGVINAIVDSVGEGQYAHLDERGRYKIILPFDRANKERDEAQASWWIPMAQPNAGENSGMHFPLLKGAEVLLSFIAGDPDRPIITGAVPNAASPSVVREDNHTVNKIKTASNNIIEMEDEEDSERIKLYSPNSNSYFHLGAANPIYANGLMMMTSGGLYQEIGGGYQITQVTTPHLSSTLHTDSSGNSQTEGISDATHTSVIDGEDTATDLINEQSVYSFAKVDNSSGGNSCTGKLLGTLGSPSSDTCLTQAEERSGDYLIYREAGNKYYYNGGGNTFTFFGTTKDFCYGTGYEVTYINPTSSTTWDGSLPEDTHKGGVEPPANMIISKMIGDTYDYQHGKNEAVHVGDADEYHKGFAKSVHNGSSNERSYGDAATAGEAIAAKLEGAVHATDITGKLSGVSIDASAQLLNVDIARSLVHAEYDVCKTKISYSDASVEYNYTDGNDSQMAQKSIFMKSPKISLNAGPVIMHSPTGTAQWAAFLTGAFAAAEANTKVPGLSKFEMNLTNATLDAPVTNIKAKTVLNLKGTSTSIEGTASFSAKGAKASLQGTATLDLKGVTTKVEGSGALALKSNAALKADGSIINVSAKSLINIKGTIVQLG